MPSSPDIPAYYSYLIVALVGGMVARSTVNDGLGTYPDRWSFFATWQLFLAYTILPVLLFWFLDYSSVIQDSSLFAALLVAAGYRSIFAGGLQSVTLPGESAGLWKPFQAWVARINDRIATQQKVYLDNFVRRLELEITSDPARLDRFMKVVLDHVRGAPTKSQEPAKPEEKAKAADAAKLEDPAKARAIAKPEVASRPVESLQSAEPLQAAFNAISPEARLQRFRLLWRAFRQAEPINYGYILYRERLIGPVRYWWQFRQGLADVITAGLLILIAAIGLFSYFESSFPSYVVNRIVVGNAPASDWKLASGDSVIRYYQWRLRKLNASDRDNFRSREYVKFMAAHAVGCDGLDAFEHLITPVIEDLCFSAEPSKKADDILGLIMETHSPLIETRTIPPLIQCLWTDNADNRLRIEQTLIALQQADYQAGGSQKSVDALKSWVPGKDEKPGDVAVWVKNWSDWSDTALAAQKAICTNLKSTASKS